MVTKETWMPTEEQLTVAQEINLSTPAFKAAAIYMGKEFMLCRNEEEDPRRCLKEGAAVTACGVRFLQQIKKQCRAEFEDYAHCIDQAHKKLCRVPQRFLDECVLEKLNISRPRALGYYARLHVHNSERPKPNKLRDYVAEAAAIGAINDLPADYPLRDDYRMFTNVDSDWFNV